MATRDQNTNPQTFTDAELRELLGKGGHASSAAPTPPPKAKAKTEIPSQFEIKPTTREPLIKFAKPGDKDTPGNRALTAAENVLLIPIRGVEELIVHSPISATGRREALNREENQLNWQIEKARVQETRATLAKRAKEAKQVEFDKRPKFGLAVAGASLKALRESKLFRKTIDQPLPHIAGQEGKNLKDAAAISAALAGNYKLAEELEADVEKGSAGRGVSEDLLMAMALVGNGPKNAVINEMGLAQATIDQKDFIEQPGKKAVARILPDRPMPEILSPLMVIAEDINLLQAPYRAGDTQPVLFRDRTPTSPIPADVVGIVTALERYPKVRSAVDLARIIKTNITANTLLNDAILELVAHGSISGRMAKRLFHTISNDPILRKAASEEMLSELEKLSQRKTASGEREETTTTGNKQIITVTNLRLLQQRPITISRDQMNAVIDEILQFAGNGETARLLDEALFDQVMIRLIGKGTGNSTAAQRQQWYKVGKALFSDKSGAPIPTKKLICHLMERSVNGTVEEQKLAQEILNQIWHYNGLPTLSAASQRAYNHVSEVGLMIESPGPSSKKLTGNVRTDKQLLPKVQITKVDGQGNRTFEPTVGYENYQEVAPKVAEVLTGKVRATIKLLSELPPGVIAATFVQADLVSTLMQNPGEGQIWTFLSHETRAKINRIVAAEFLPHVGRTQDVEEVESDMLGEYAHPILATLNSLDALTAYTPQDGLSDNERRSLWAFAASFPQASNTLKKVLNFSERNIDRGEPNEVMLYTLLWANAAAQINSLGGNPAPYAEQAINLALDLLETPSTVDKDTSLRNFALGVLRGLHETVLDTPHLNTQIKTDLSLIIGERLRSACTQLEDAIHTEGLQTPTTNRLQELIFRLIGFLPHRDTIYWTGSNRPTTSTLTFDVNMNPKDPAATIFQATSGNGNLDHFTAMGRKRMTGFFSNQVEAIGLRATDPLFAEDAAIVISGFLYSRVVAPNLPQSTSNNPLLQEFAVRARRTREAEESRNYTETYYTDERWMDSHRDELSRAADQITRAREIGRPIEDFVFRLMSAAGISAETGFADGTSIVDENARLIYFHFSRQRYSLPPQLISAANLLRITPTEIVSNFRKHQENPELPKILSWLLS